MKFIPRSSYIRWAPSGHLIMTHGKLLLLGGIGTGNISVGARGELRDWEIFNSPRKGNYLPYTFFAIRAEKEGENPLQRY